MVKRTTVAALLCLMVSACLTAPSRPRFPSARFAIPESVRVQYTERGESVVGDVPLEEYVRASILSEFAPAAGEVEIVERMLEVQAVISRTYAASHAGRHARDGFDLCATTHCQLYEPERVRRSRWADAAATAVERTAGVVLRFNETTAQALFHADCGGRTSTASAVWGGDDRAYLTSHADDGVPDETHAQWEYRVDAAALARALDLDDRTRAPGAVDRVEVARRDESGRAQDMVIRRTPSGAARRSDGFPAATAVRADALRQILSRSFGARAIRSTWFDVRRDGRVFVFSGRGFGHGVGLCQAGALARIRGGSSLEDVMRFYYPGTSLELARP